MWNSGKGTEMSISEFVTGYMDAAEWTQSDDSHPDYDPEVGDGPYLEDTDAEWSVSACERIARDCVAFYEAHSERFDTLTSPPRECTVDEYAGHNFWLTRNGHGCGFWDGRHEEPHGTILSEAARGWGEVWTAVGDDRLIYLD